MQTFLIAYTSATGDQWGLMRAASEDQIRAAFPELVILKKPPEWMTETRYERLGLHKIEEEPWGLIGSIVRQRERL